MKILSIPNEILRKKSQTVTGQERHLSRHIDQVVQTLAKSDIGVGLAANQIGIDYQILATKFPSADGQSWQNDYYLNPQIVRASQEKTTKAFREKKDDLEGCLSVPKVYAPILRHTWIELVYQQLLDGQLVQKKALLKDFPARVLQHEIDHLNGILFIDHAFDQKQPLFRENNGQLEDLSWSDFEKIFGKIF